MKILELCFSKAWGGLEIYVTKFVKEFIKAGNEVVCVTIPNSKLNDDIKKNGFKNIEVLPRLKYLDFSTAFQIKNSMNHSIDIIHVHQSRDLSTAIILKKLLKNPILVFSQQMDSRFKKKDLFHKWIYNNIDFVITMTDDMRNNHINNTVVNPNAIKTIYNGIDLVRFGINNRVNKKDIIEKFNLPDNKIIIGSVGRLDSLKNQELLIDAALILIKNSISNIHFIIIGDETNSVAGIGYKQKLLDKIKSCNLESYFTFYSFTNEIEIYFSLMDIFVLPTDKESFGYVLVEAMASGLPVIASNQGGPKEIIQENVNGFLFESRNTNDLLQKIKVLIDNSDIRIKMGKESLRIALDKFDIKKTINSYLNLFSSLVVTK